MTRDSSPDTLLRKNAVHIPPAATLAVERHDDAVWLCVVEHGQSTKLALFADVRAVETYETLIAQRMACAREAVRSERCAYCDSLMRDDGCPNPRCAGRLKRRVWRGRPATQSSGESPA